MNESSFFLCEDLAFSLKFFLDFFGSILSITTAILAAHYHRATWIVSLFAIFINGSLYFHEKIWGHFFLDIFYACSALYGWQHWKKHPTPQTLSLQQKLLMIPSIGIITIIFYLALSLLGGHMVLFDAFGTSCALFAQILTALAYCEAWPLWLLHDAMNLLVDIGRNLNFHFYKELFYFALAFYGFLKWKGFVHTLKPNTQ
jgi:nicotinamide mononucleotide transporter